MGGVCAVVMRSGLILGGLCVVGISTKPLVAQAPGASVAARNANSAALTALFHDIWEDELKRSPEFASSLGDRRYNDQVTDESPRAINDELARQQDFLARLLLIDTSGLSEQEKLSAELMQRRLIEDQEGAKFKEWEMPVQQFHGIHTDLAANLVNYPFATVKDYDDYIARLKKYPGQLRQATENLLSGIDDGRVQPAYLMEKVLKQTGISGGAEAGGERVCDAAEEVSGERDCGGSQADQRGYAGGDRR